MASIGDRLREARTRRGLSFDDVESATKVRARYLRALEAEQFDLLPGPTFARTFLRTYADYLGLDSRLLVEEYRTQHGPPEEGGDQQFAPVAAPGRTPVGPVPMPGPMVLLVAGVGAVLVFFLVLGLVVGEDEPAPPGRAGAAGTATDRADRARQRRPRPRPAPTSVSLRIVASEPTYVCVENAAGETQYEGTLTGSRRWKGRRLRVNMGKRSPRVEVNGRRVSFDRSLATPVAFEFRPQRRRQLAPGEGPCE